jgi:hypothetical protein
MPANTATEQPIGADAPQQSGRRLVLYICDRYPAALVDTIQTVRERCDRLEAAGTLDGYQLEHWPPCTTGDHTLTDRQPSRREQIATFQTWAADNGYTLEPAFHTQTITSTLLSQDVRYEHVSVPLVTLALYEDGELTGVAPCSDGGRTHTVNDGLAALEAAAFNAFPEPPTVQDAASTEAAVSER